MDAMPGSTTISNDKVATHTQDNVMGTHQQPSSSSVPKKDGQTSTDVNGECIPTRIIGKTSKLSSHNPLQFVKVQSPLYVKAEEQIKLTKEVKLTRESLKEGEEEWQCNLDNWKSRRRKVSERVLQRAKDMQQIEAQEHLHQEKLQQKKIKKFSEIVEKRSARSYSLDLYISQEDDSGLGGTPEPDDTLDCQTSVLSSDTSEEMMSESDSIDSDIHNYNKINDEFNQSVRLTIKPGDNRGFGFVLKGGKEQEGSVKIENVFKGGAADEVGLKDGDKIVLLNGELTADSSYASLIFSLKQAVHTGILDLVITQSKNTENHGNLCPEMQTRESRKGKSFAEKLAIFSAGISTPKNIDDSKSNPKVVDPKRESLVLRRRSAFENGKSDDVVNRRLSCISDSRNMHRDNFFEKRYSVDFVLPQNVNNFSKKGPPPPVPVKPKIKSKPIYFDSSKMSEKSSESSLSSADKTVTPPQNIHESLNILDSRLHVENESPKLENQDESSERNLINNFVLEGFFSKTNIGDASSSNEYVNEDLKVPDKVTNFDRVGDNGTDKMLTSFEANEPLEQIQDLVNEKPSLFKESFYNKIQDFSNDDFEILLESEWKAESKDGSPQVFCIDKKLLGETSLYINELDAIEPAMKFPNDYINEDCLETNIEKESKVNSVSSACKSTCDNKEDLNKTLPSDYRNVQETEESDDIENKSNIQATISPLCLSLEKIDDDDVISASTTTSSDTPDTETVIETLPSNLSPLPNDESNGEDSSKLLKCQEEESDHLLISASEKKEETVQNHIECENAQNFDENEIVNNYDIEIFKNYNDGLLEPKDGTLIPEDEFPQTTISDGVKIDKIDQHDDEYAQELEESLDQITSLDIIDRIEQSLMDQLQKEDPFEDLNCQLESDIANPWLYYNDETELLEDFLPRNLEPPCERPPPPPAPESENNLNKVMSIARTNSTKRIKKELWRRRSDFLGLDSPDAIDVDNIPPPPPGLEELFKQEREQTQWLEKRLSLTEPEIDSSSYSAESACLDSENYSNKDYSAYFMDENSKETTIGSEQQEWKNNMTEESLFETTFEIQYESTLSTGIDESLKLTESPQLKTKQNIHSLGAAPKAKIMDSTKWITEKTTTVNKKSFEPLYQQTTYNQNYWLTQDSEQKRNSDNHTDRRYSIPPVYSNLHPDITWGDREYECQQYRPRSAICNKFQRDDDQFVNMDKKILQRTQSLDSHRGVDYNTDTLESEVHKCSCCGKGLCEGSAMGIEALHLYFHIECFRCCLCRMQLGNGSCGTDVQVKNNQLYCPSCFTVD